MFYWIALLLLLFTVCAGGLIYLAHGASRFSFIKRLIPIRRKRLWISFVFITGAAVAACLTLGYMNAVAIILHFIVFSLICNGIGMLCRSGHRHDITGVAALLITVVYMAFAAYNACHVDITLYTVSTEKEVGTLRIVQFADSHVGTTFHSDGFKAQLARMNTLCPDVVVITGDFVDDDTSKEDMLACCEALGTLETTYGVYYCFGNHDKGYYDPAYRGYGYAELVQALTQNGVTVLEDESAIIDGRFAVIGRQDYEVSSRAPISELLPDDSGLYTIVLDHEPRDYAAEQECGADLVLSGHTHGGQFIPINYVGVLTGENDMRYGHEKRGNTDFIVTSGLSDWAFIFKTGCKSEFVVIDIQGE